jgi:L-ascorbate metabolism protein UlaG (beta-lactamase superfamily)
VTVTAVTLLRHATIVVEIAGQSIVVDPMLDPAGARGPIANSPEPRDNPLVDLPSNVDEVLTGLVAAVVTHLHADHLDAAGARFLARERLATFGQAVDLESLAERGVAPASKIGSGGIGEVRLHRTDGEHGVGEIGERLGPVSGVVLEHGDERIYVAGDTIPCPAVDAAMLRYDPTTVVLNAGGARFLVGDPITMTALDVVEFGRRHPAVTVVAASRSRSPPGPTAGLRSRYIRPCAVSTGVRSARAASTACTQSAMARFSAWTSRSCERRKGNDRHRRRRRPRRRHR